jgi:hypothetical protein
MSRAGPFTTPVPVRRSGQGSASSAAPRAKRSPGAGLYGDHHQPDGPPTAASRAAATQPTGAPGAAPSDHADVAMSALCTPGRDGALLVCHRSSTACGPAATSGEPSPVSSATAASTASGDPPRRRDPPVLGGRRCHEHQRPGTPGCRAGVAARARRRSNGRSSLDSSRSSRVWIRHPAWSSS